MGYTKLSPPSYTASLRAQLAQCARYHSSQAHKPPATAEVTPALGSVEGGLIRGGNAKSDIAHQKSHTGDKHKTCARTLLILRAREVTRE